MANIKYVLAICLLSIFKLSYSFETYYGESSSDVLENIVGGYANENGRLRYSVELEFPESINNLVPQIQATHSQGAAKGNLGAGFSLLTGSRISRCSKRILSHGVVGPGITGPEYTYCLDGVPLRYKNSSVLAPYNSEHQKVTYEGVISDPDSWLVQDGTGYEFLYQVVDSNVADSDKNWVLKEHRDVWGNKLEYTYHPDGRIEKIIYPGFEVRFNYREPVRYQYVFSNGSERRLGDLIESVGLYRSSSLIYQYEFRYEIVAGYQAESVERLAGMRKCYRFNAEKCTRELQFEYSNVAGSSPAYESRATEYEKTIIIPKTVIARHWDLDDLDGLPPYIKANVDNMGLEEVCFYSGLDTLVCAVSSDGGGYEIKEEMSYPFELEGPDEKDYYAGMNFVDIGLDGYTDLCMADTRGIKCAKGRSESNNKYFYHPVYVNEQLDFASGYQIIDVTSDGYPDLCGAVSDTAYSCFENPGNSSNIFSSTPVLTVEGDFRKKESMHAREEYRGHRGQRRYQDAYLNYKRPQATLVDVNGDSVSDLCSFDEGVLSCRGGEYNSSNMLEFSGVSHTRQVFVEEINFHGDSDNTSQVQQVKNKNFVVTMTFRWVDINSDGLIDICFVREDVLKCHENNGLSWESERTLVDFLNVRSEEYSGYSYDTLNQIYASIDYFDINTDGYLDVCYMWVSVHHCAYIVDDVVSDIDERLRISEDEVLFAERGHYFGNQLRKWFSEETDYTIFRATAVYGPVFYMDDVNADYRTDICMRTWEGVECHSNRQQTHYSLLKGVKDSYGNVTHFNYESIASGLSYSNSSFYSSWKEFAPSGLLLDSIAIDTGVNDSGNDFETISYRYGAFKADRLTGEGSFEFIEQESDISGKRQYTKFYLRNYLGGKVSSVMEYQNGVLISRTENNTTMVGNNGFWFTRPNFVQSWMYSPDSSEWIRYEKREYNDFDEFDLAQETIVTKKAYIGPGEIEINTVTTNNTFQHDTHNWIIGKPSRQVVSHELTGASPQTRTVEYAYLSGTMALDYEVFEPDSQYEKKLEYEYYGNGLVSESSAIGWVNSTETQTRTKSYTYNDYGQKLTTTDSLGTTTIEYHADCLSPEKTYDLNNRLVVQNNYSDSCEVTSSSLLSGEIKSFSSDWVSGVALSPSNASVTNNYIIRTTESSNTGSISTNFIDRAGRVVKESVLVSADDRSSQSTIVYYHYDNQGFNIAKSRPLISIDGNEQLPVWQTSHYDRYFRPSSSTFIAPDGQLSTRTFSYDGLSTSQTFNGNTTTEIVGVLGKPISVEEFGKRTSYHYSAIGELVQTIQGGDPDAKIEIEYDEFGFKTSQVEPATGDWEYKFNSFGELYWQKDAEGNITETQYDVLGRVSRVSMPEGQNSWSYYTRGGGKGKLEYEYSHDGLKRSYEYDSNGKLVNSYLHDGAVEISRTHYLYDEYGRLLTSELNKNAQNQDMVMPLSFGFDDSGRVKTVSTRADKIKSYDFDAIQSSYDQVLLEIIDLNNLLSRLENRMAYHAHKISYYESKVAYFRRASDGLELDTSAIEQQIAIHQENYEIMMDVRQDLLEKSQYYIDQNISDRYTYQGYDPETGAHGFGYEYCARPETRFMVLTRCVKWERGYIGLTPTDFNLIFPDTSALEVCSIVTSRNRYPIEYPAPTYEYVGFTEQETWWGGTEQVYQFRYCVDRRFNPADFERDMADIYHARAQEEQAAINQLQNNIDNAENASVTVQREIIAYKESWAPVSINPVVMIPVQVPYDATEEVIMNRQAAIAYYQEREAYYQSLAASHQTEKQNLESQYATASLDSNALEIARQELLNNIEQLASLNALAEAADAQEALGDENLVIWAALSYDAEGRLKDELFGNGVITKREVNSDSGVIEEITTKRLGGNVLSQLEYSYTKEGNLDYREDTARGITEDFQYRDNQLDYWEMDASSGVQYSRDYEYDALGNITKRKGGNEYFGYQDSSNPYRLTHFSPDSNTATSIRYDSKGYMVSAAGRNYEWTSYGKARNITKGQYRVSFEYDANKSRTVKRDSQGVTYYVSPNYEKTIKANGDVLHKYYIRNGYEVVASIERIEYAEDLDDEIDTRPQDSVAYYSRDIIGSGLIVTGPMGEVVADRFYSPYGEELSLIPAAVGGVDSTFDSQSSIMTSYLLENHKDAVTQAEAELGTDEIVLGRLLTVSNAASYFKGFTSHEKLNDVGLVHMNARLYDPQMARFVSPDSIVPESKKPLAYNRYAYGYNNPALVADPTGHFLWEAINLYSDDEGLIFMANMAVVIAATAATGGQGYAPAKAALYAGGAALYQSAMLSGRIQGPEIRAAVFAGASAAAANHIGHGGVTEAGVRGGPLFAKTWQTAAAHGVSQGTLAMMQGKAFWRHFVAGYLSHQVGKYVHGKIEGSYIERAAGSTMAAAGIGALSASITGGDEIEAAYTAAMVHLFNELAGQGVQEAENAKFKAKLSFKIRKWIEAGASSDGKAFAKIAGGEFSLTVDESGKAILSRGANSIDLQVSDGDLDFLVKGVSHKFEFGGLSTKVGLNSSGAIAWSGTIKPPGAVNSFLNRLGIGASFSVSGSVDPTAMLRKTMVGDALYRYGRGTTDYVNQCDQNNYAGC